MPFSILQRFRLFSSNRNLLAAYAFSQLRVARLIPGPMEIRKRPVSTVWPG